MIDWFEYKNKRMVNSYYIKISLSVVLSFILSFACFSQKRILTQEIQVESHNDNYTFSFESDSYYTNGLFIRYRFLKDARFRRRHSIDKVVRSYEISHQIFTPKELIWSDLGEFDRPYAGLLSFSAANEYFYETESHLKLKLSIGWMGSILNTGAIQKAFHEIANTQPPLGWQYEINNGPVINGYGAYSQNIAFTGKFDITSETNAALGTTFNFLRQEFMMRFGKFKPIHKSSQYGGALGIKSHQRGIQEFYFFVSPGIEFVGYNATIEGQLIGKSSPHTEERVPWVYQTRAGILLSWATFDLAISYYQRTKETTEATHHEYVGLQFSKRF